MLVKSKNNKDILLRKLTPDDHNALAGYLENLSSETVKRFGPHGFDKQSIYDLYQDQDMYSGYIALDCETDEIIAYSVIKTGFLDHDASRLQSYGLTLNHKTDCTFAPSVADQWQSQGVGNSLFHYMLYDLKSKGIKRIILWGGVQSDNVRAVNYYLKNGFQNTGQFEYNGLNDDMLLNIG